MKIIKKITIDLNKAYTHHSSFEVRQGDNGRYLQTEIDINNVPFNIPEDYTATFDAVVENITVAKDKACEIDREQKVHYVLIPIDKTITTVCGYIKLIVKLKKDNCVVSAQEISGEIVKSIDSDSTEDIYTPIIETNAVLASVVEGDSEVVTGIDTYRRDRLIPILAESKEALFTKGVEVPENAKLDFIPSGIEKIESAGEYKELAETYRVQYEAEKLRADTAEIEVKRLESELADAGRDTQTLVDLIEGDFTEFVIPEDVTKIRAGAFYRSEVTSITIPNSVTIIGDYAFAFSKLSNFIIPNTVTELGSSICDNCTNLTSVTISNAVTGIPTWAFRQTSLVEVYIPNGVKVFGSQPFWGCGELKTIYLPNTLTSIDASVFSGCSNIVDVTLELGFNCNNLNLSSSEKIAPETVHNMIIAYADRTGQTALTLTIHINVYNALSDETKALASSKNITLIGA